MDCIIPAEDRLQRPNATRFLKTMGNFVTSSSQGELWSVDLRSDKYGLDPTFSFPFHY
jgi:hypothetical protein